MEQRTIQAGRGLSTRFATRRVGLSAAGIVALESLVAALGGSLGALSVLALVVAPGLALIPLLPERAAASWTASLTAAPGLGIASASVALISLSSAGLPLNGLSIRLTLAGLVLIGLALPGGREPAGLPARTEALAALGLLAAVGAGIVLQARVLSGDPVPGNDWAKYVLYADEIKRQGSLLIDNPFWMLGVPFREDPGAPALYGAFLELTGEPAGVMAHGIWAFAVVIILSTFALARSFWGDGVAVLAAGFVALLPISHDILGWHGLANLAALSLLPLLLLYVTALVTDGLEPAAAGGLGLLLVALAAMHRLTFLVALASVVAAACLAALFGERRRVAGGALTAAVAAIALCPGVVYDLVTRSRTFGGTQGYESYLSAKVELVPVAQDLTWVFTALALVAVVLAVRWSVRERALLPLLCALAVVVALAYAWIVHVPLVYFRMAYFLPVILAPIAALALVRLLGARGAALAGVAALGVIAGFAWGQAANVRDFYAFANDTSLRGLDALSAELRPGEVVVTDRCWSFLGTWLLHTRTLPALLPEDIQPKAEAVRAAEGRAVLAGTPEGRRAARRLGVRYAIVDPACTDAVGDPLRPPRAGSPLFLSERLAVLRLPPG